MTSTNALMAGKYKTRQVIDLYAGIFMPVEHCCHSDKAAINGGGYGVEGLNKWVAPMNRTPIQFDGRKPAVSVLVEAITVTFNSGFTNTLTEAVMPNIINANFHDTTLAIVEHNAANP